MRICKECGVEIEGKRRLYCQECAKERNRQYRKKYLSKPEVIKYRSEYRKKPEVIERKRKYAQRPDQVKKRRIASWKRQGIKEPKNGWDLIFKILEKQGYCCAICGKHQDKMKRKLHLDHNHTTGEIRAFLCDNCNRLLGNVNDDINILEKAINYLRNK